MNTKRVTAPNELACVTLVLGHELTGRHATVLREGLLEAAERTVRLELDLSRVLCIDARALIALLLAVREAIGQGKAVCLVDPSPAVLAIIDFFRIGELLRGTSADPAGRSGRAVPHTLH